jgi:hypothetical protein
MNKELIFLNKFTDNIDSKGYVEEADALDVVIQRLAQMSYTVSNSGDLKDANGNSIKSYSGGKLPSNTMTSFALEPDQIEKFKSKVGPNSPPIVITSKDGTRILFVHSSRGVDGDKTYTAEPGKSMNQQAWDQYKSEKGWTGIKEITCFGGSSDGASTITGNIGETQAAIDENTGNLLINPTS